jgi:hypothetical protein
MSTAKITKGRFIDVELLPVETSKQTAPFRFKFEKTLNWNVGGELMEFYGLESFYPFQSDLGRLSWSISCSNYVVKDGSIDIAIKEAMLNNEEFYIFVKYDFSKKVTFESEEEPVGLVGRCFISEANLSCSNGEYVDLELTLTGKNALKQIRNNQISSIRYGVDCYFDTSKIDKETVSSVLNAVCLINKTRFGFQEYILNPYWYAYDKITNSQLFDDSELNRGYWGGQRNRLHYFGDLHDRTDWYDYTHAKYMGMSTASSAIQMWIMNRTGFKYGKKYPTRWKISSMAFWFESDMKIVTPIWLKRNYTLTSDGSVIEEWMITMEYVGFLPDAPTYQLFILDN